MEYNEELQVLKPNLSTLAIGRKRLTNITILPLSFFDQERLFSQVSSAVAEALSNLDKIEDINVLLFIKDIITKNIKDIISYVVDPEEELDMDIILRSITNEQVLKLVGIVWEDNYAGPFEREGKVLLEKIQKAFPSATSLQPSVSDTPSPSEPSLEVTETEG